jgi:hypothetical protein
MLKSFLATLISLVVMKQCWVGMMELKAVPCHHPVQTDHLVVHSNPRSVVTPNSHFHKPLILKMVFIASRAASNLLIVFCIGE